MQALNIDIVTLFPKMFHPVLKESLLGKAQKKGLIKLEIHNLRDYTQDKHRKVDDKPFGGGVGMVLKVEPLYTIIKHLSKKKGAGKPYVVYLSPQGQTLNQKIAFDLSQKKHLILICGHYEGIDQRAMQWIHTEISIGDYVLTGGELPAMVLTDVVCRLLPGVIKKQESIEKDSFFESKLDYSHYTRPAKFLNMKVPKVLLSGNHKEIAAWRTKNAQENTLRKRPELLEKCRT
jgi:tRNA (guanine37-N1)-methyltransferase